MRRRLPRITSPNLRSPVVDLKVKWADHHRELLHSALLAFRGEHDAYFVRKDRRVHEGSEYWTLKAIPEPPPDEIGLILADFIRNLRASLDYLVGEMRRDGATRNSGFPIILQRPKGPHGFRKRCCIYLHGIPDEAAKLIHWMQPYHGAEPGTFREALATLETLWNISKHRSLFVITATTLPNYVGRSRSDEDAPRIGWRFPLPDDSSEIWLPISEEEEAFDPHFAVEVSLAQPRGFAKDWPGWIARWDVDGLVDHLYRIVRYEVLPQFNHFLQPVTRDQS